MACGAILGQGRCRLRAESGLAPLEKGSRGNGSRGFFTPSSIMRARLYFVLQNKCLFDVFDVCDPTSFEVFALFWVHVRI
jgi:hypothetical protein